MRVCGIIAEYDPFHNGHAWQLSQAKKLSRADYVICVMSCQITQRGMPAYFDAHDRAEMALRSGADIVLGLPYAFSVCDSERFALGGIEILRKTNAVQHLSFGIEEQGLPYFTKAAALLENPTAEYTEKLHALLAQGVSFPRAQGDALGSVLNVDSSIFSLPNTSLAVCYTRLAMRQSANFTLYPVLRRGAYHANDLPEQASCALPSATAVRSALENNQIESVRAALPESAYQVLCRALNENRCHKPHALDALLRWKLRQAPDFSKLPDLSEGIENRFRNAAQLQTRNDMVLSVKTKRYPYARINRIFSHLLTDTDAASLDALPEYAYLLGFRKSASDLLHTLSHGELPLLHRLPSGNLTPMQQLDARADDLWSLGAGRPFGALYRAKPVILP